MVFLNLFMNKRLSFQNGFQTKVNYARNCEGIENPVIKLINSSMTLNEKCEVIVSGCSQVRSYKTSIVSKNIENFIFSLDFSFFNPTGKLEGD